MKLQRTTHRTQNKQYKTGKQTKINKEHTTQKPKDTKGVIRGCLSKDRQYNV
jgi:hypothetical protein